MRFQPASTNGESFSQNRFKENSSPMLTTPPLHDAAIFAIVEGGPGGEVRPPTKQPGRLSRLLQSVHDFLFGMMGMEFAEHALEMRGSLESLFMLGTVGELIGVPILPPYYSLRLLPYLVPNIQTWKRRVLREREFTDEHDYHLEGL